MMISFYVPICRRNGITIDDFQKDVLLEGVKGSEIPNFLGNKMIPEGRIKGTR